MDAYARVSGHLRRLWETLGLERRARPVKSLDEHLAEKARAKALQAPAMIDAAPIDAKAEAAT